MGDGQGAAGEIQHPIPLLLAIEQLGQVGVGFPQVGGLGHRPEIPVPGLVRHIFMVISGGDIPHGGRPLVGPVGPGHGQVPLQGGDAVVPAAIVQVLPAQIVDVPVILRVLRHRQLQQGQILPPGLLWVRVVVQLHPVGHHRGSRLARPGPAQHLVYRVDPLIAPAGVGLLIPEHHPLRAVRLEGPGVAISRLTGAGGPGPLQQFPPAEVEHLVQVGADADVCLRRDQLHGAVPGRVKAPGGDGLLRDAGPQAAQQLRRAVGGAGVQHHDVVRLGHGRHPAAGKLGLVLADGVDADAIVPHFAPSLWKLRRSLVESAAVQTVSWPAVRPPAGSPAAR